MTTHRYNALQTYLRVYVLFIQCSQYSVHSGPQDLSFIFVCLLWMNTWVALKASIKQHTASALHCYFAMRMMRIAKLVSSVLSWALTSLGYSSVMWWDECKAFLKRHNPSFYLLQIYSYTTDERFNKDGKSVSHSGEAAGGGGFTLF